jgi:putative phosphoesterase
VLIGVISDTHIPSRSRSLPIQLVDALEKVDLIIHAGDLTGVNLLTELKALAPVKSVYGNSDSWEIRRILPRTALITVGSFQIGVIHGDRMGFPLHDRLISLFPEANCIVYGHTHVPCCTMIGGVLLFNPGSPTDKRGCPHYTYGILRIDRSLHGEIINL